MGLYPGLLPACQPRRWWVSWTQSVHLSKHFFSYFYPHGVQTHHRACILRSASCWTRAEVFFQDATCLSTGYTKAAVAFEKALPHIHVAIAAFQLHHRARIRGNFRETFYPLTLLHITIPYCLNSKQTWLCFTQAMCGSSVRSTPLNVAVNFFAHSLPRYFDTE